MTSLGRKGNQHFSCYLVLGIHVLIKQNYKTSMYSLMFNPYNKLCTGHITVIEDIF